MSTREYIINEVNILPEGVLEKVQAFIREQKISLGLYENDTDYLSSVPGMKEKINTASQEPTADGVTASQLWSNV